MRAAVLRDLGRPMVVEQVDIDKPAAREVLVRIVASGLCHSDLHVLDGKMPQRMPLVLGHEPAGVVEQVGADVRSVRPGDHVVVSLTFHCGHCAACQSGFGHRCDNREAMHAGRPAPRLSANGEALTPFVHVGAFAEMILVDESGCVAIPKDIPLDRACLLGCGVSTGFGAVVTTAKVQAGDTVAVIGCGGVGLAAINGAEIAGAARIIAIDMLDGKLEMAKTYGATDVVNAASDPVAQVMALTGGHGVDHAFEVVGSKETIENAFAMIARGGTATIVGVPGLRTRIDLPAFAFLGEKKIQGSTMGGVRLARDIPRLVELYRQGRLKLDPLVSKRIALEDVNTGFEDMRAGTVARSVIVME